MIRVEHPNGYTGILYGNSSMVVLENGKEILHTGSRIGLNTEQELYKYLDEFPEFKKKLERVFEEEE